MMARIGQGLTESKNFDTQELRDAVISLQTDLNRLREDFERQVRDSQSAATIIEGSGGAAGSANEIQYNNGSGIFAASSNFIWDNSSRTLSSIAAITSSVGITFTVANGSTFAITAGGTGNFTFEKWEALIVATLTTNATPIAVNIITITNESVLADVRVVARRTGGTAGSAGDSAAYIRRALYKDISGVTSLVGSIQDDFTSESQAGWDCTFTTSGSTVQIQVTGATNNNISWDIVAFYYRTVTT